MTSLRGSIDAWISSTWDSAQESSLAGIDKIIESCAGSDPEDQGYAYFAKGNLLIRLGRHTEALSCLRTAATFDHDNPSILYNLGMEEFTAGNQRRANEYLLRAAQLGHDKAPVALENLKSGIPVAFMLGSESDADSAIERHIKCGMASVAASRYDDALIDYNRAIALAPDVGHTYTLRGVVFEKLERFEEALADHDRAVQLSPDDAVAHYNRGVVHERLGNNSEALLDYTRAIELDPTDADFFCNRGNVQLGAGRFQEASADFSRAIELNSRFALAYNNRCNARSQLMDFDGAMKDISTALSLAPEEMISTA